MSTDALSVPRGKHSVSLGPGLQAAIDSQDGGPSQPPPLTDYYSFKYDFQPNSLDATKQGRINLSEQFDGHGLAPFQLERANTQSDDAAHYYAGTQQQAKDWECVLIFDEATGTFTLEKLDCSFELKYDRAASKQGANGRMPSPLPPAPPMDDSPSNHSGVTFSSSSPPTPPNLVQEDQVQVRAASASDMEIGRPKLAGKSLAMPKPKGKEKEKGKKVAPEKTKGKRPRDEQDDKAPRPTKRPTPPPPALPKPTPAPEPPRPLSLPRRPPSPPRRNKSPPAYVPSTAFALDDNDSDQDSSAPLASNVQHSRLAGKTLSKGFTLEVDENPVFAEGLVEEDGPSLEELAEIEADPDADEDEDEEDEEEDPFEQALQDAFNEGGDTTVTTGQQAGKMPMSLNAFAGGGDDDDDEDEDEDEESDEDDSD